jgi:hypothetical protein
MNLTTKKGDGGIDFKAFEVSEHNVKVCCEIVKERFKADAERLGIKVKIPKIEARAVVDEDFEKLRMYSHQEVMNCGNPIAIAEERRTQRFEYGINHPIDKDWIKACNGWTHIVWNDEQCKEIKWAEIYIRASIYDKNPKKFYAVLEHEVAHALFPNVIFKENELKGDYEND